MTGDCKLTMSEKREPKVEFIKFDIKCCFVGWYNFCKPLCDSFPQKSCQITKFSCRKPQNPILKQKPIENPCQGRQKRQGSQGLALGWILYNRNWWRQRWHASEGAATMASLPAKNLPWQSFMCYLVMMTTPWFDKILICHAS